MDSGVAYPFIAPTMRCCHADAWQAVRSGWDGHVLVVAGVDFGAEAAAGSQSKALTPAQRAMAATKRWVRLTSPLMCAH